MKKKNQNIKCSVEDCKFCNTDEFCCSLDEIKVCGCPCCDKKEETMCNSYEKK